MGMVSACVAGVLCVSFMCGCVEVVCMLMGDMFGKCNVVGVGVDSM